MKYTHNRVSSKSEWAKDNLTEYNHIGEFKGSIYELYGVEESVVENGKRAGVEHQITGWWDDAMSRDDEGNPLDIHFYEGEDGTIVWEPYIEYLMKLRFVNKGYGNIKFGWIDGIKHHIAPFPTKGINSSNNKDGYTFWVEFDKPLRNETNIG